MELRPLDPAVSSLTPDGLSRRELIHHTERRIANIIANGGTIVDKSAPLRPERRDFDARPQAAATASAVDRRGAADRPDDSRGAAERLEGVMISQVVERMREAANVRLFGESAGAQIHEGLFDTMVGDAMARSGGLGLYREVEASIRRTQGPERA
jgi:hypothetical protein